MDKKPHIEHPDVSTVGWDRLQKASHYCKLSPGHSSCRVQFTYNTAVHVYNMQRADHTDYLHSTILDFLRRNLHPAVVSVTIVQYYGNMFKQYHEMFHEKFSRRLMMMFCHLFVRLLHIWVNIVEMGDFRQ